MGALDWEQKRLGEPFHQKRLGEPFHWKRLGPIFFFEAGVFGGSRGGGDGGAWGARGWRCD